MTIMLIMFYACLAIFALATILLSFLGFPILLFLGTFALIFGPEGALMVTITKYFLATSTVGLIVTMLASVLVYKSLSELLKIRRAVVENKIEKKPPTKSEDLLHEDVGKAKTFKECLELYSQAKPSSDLEALALERALELAKTKEECWIVGHYAPEGSQAKKMAGVKAEQFENLSKE